MRSFITASALLAVIIILIIANSIYVNNRISELLSICSELKTDSPADSLVKLNEKWQSCRNILALSANSIDIEQVDSAILSLTVQNGTDGNFEYRLKLLENMLRHIAFAQNLTLGSIF